MYSNLRKKKASSSFAGQPETKQRKPFSNNFIKQEAASNSYSSSSMSNPPSSTELDRTATELDDAASVWSPTANAEDSSSEAESTVVTASRPRRTARETVSLVAKPLALLDSDDSASELKDTIQVLPKRRETAVRKPTASTQPTRRNTRRKLGTLDNQDKECFMPSEANNWKFKYGSPETGRTAAELNKLLTPPDRAPLEPPNTYMALSYDRFGEPPPQALIEKLEHDK